MLKKIDDIKSGGGYLLPFFAIGEGCSTERQTSLFYSLCVVFCDKVNFNSHYS